MNLALDAPDIPRIPRPAIAFNSDIESSLSLYLKPLTSLKREVIKEYGTVSMGYNRAMIMSKVIGYARRRATEWCSTAFALGSPQTCLSLPLSPVRNLPYLRWTCVTREVPLYMTMQCQSPRPSPGHAQCKVSGRVATTLPCPFAISTCLESWSTA